MSNTIKLVALGAGIAAVVIVTGKLTKMLPAVGNAFNPLSDQNLAYKGVNGVVSSAVGYEETLGGWLADTFSSKGDAVKEMLNPPKRTSDADAYFSTAWDNPMGDFYR